MGTRINVVMDHDISDYRDQSAVLAQLAGTLPAALAVRDYWAAGRDASLSEKDDQWAADLITPYEEHHRNYTGPGKLFLKVGPYAAKIRTGGRWRGFLSIPPLRQMHLQAFRSIASALGATRIAYFPEDDELFDLFYEGGNLNEALTILERDFGQPQPSIKIISPTIVEETDSQVPCVWYRENITIERRI